MKRLIPGLCLLAFAQFSNAGLGGQVPANEGVLPVAAVPAHIMKAAAQACPGMLANKAEFYWLDDRGLYVLEGTCKGDQTQVRIAGDGELIYLGSLKDD